jgi:hypothetical protein
MVVVVRDREMAAPRLLADHNHHTTTTTIGHMALDIIGRKLQNAPWLRNCG